MGAPAVVIAATNLMPSLRDRLEGEGELLTFADTEPIQALQAILEQRPRLIVLERLFAATPRGAALINRIKTDPQLGHAEVRVMSHTGDYLRQVAKPAIVEAPEPPSPVQPSAPQTPAITAAPIVVATPVEEAAPEIPPPPIERTVVTEEPPRPLDWHGTRRAPRHRIRSAVDVQLDGNPATLVDLSIVGAQVVSATILRPNQKVRVSIPNEDFVMRFRGAIAWAKFELPKPTAPPRYRAGVEFPGARAPPLEEFCRKNKA